MADTTVMVQSISIEEKDEIKKRSQLYVGRGKPLSAYHCAMNKAVAQLRLKNPSLLWNRGTLLEEAQKVVDESGYIYSKGKFRSEHLHPSLETATTLPKRHTLLMETRTKHMEAVQENLKDISDRLSYKSKWRQAAETVRNYKLCDELTEDISNLKSRKRELEAEVAILKKKSKRSERYKGGKGVVPLVIQLHLQLYLPQMVAQVLVQILLDTLLTLRNLL